MLSLSKHEDFGSTKGDPRMRRSVDRILTTHVGSLPRPQALVDWLLKKDHGEPYDPAEYDAAIAAAVDAVVARQVEVGIDVPSDGEASKVSYSTYMMDRLNGFGGDNERRLPLDTAPHPEFRAKLARMTGVQEFRRAACIGPISVKDWSSLHTDIANMTAAMKRHGVAEGFMNAASPGLITAFQPNQYYKTHEDYVWALAEVMHEEYEAIVAAGLIVQLDCPDLAMARHIGFQDLTDAEFLKQSQIHVEAMNHALRNVPADMARYPHLLGQLRRPPRPRHPRADDHGNHPEGQAGRPSCSRPPTPAISTNGRFGGTPSCPMTRS